MGVRGRGWRRGASVELREALLELFEWGYAVVAGGAAESFLGSQGDPWDAQWDMFLAFCGAIVAQLVLAGPHDRQLRSTLAGAGD